MCVVFSCVQTCYGCPSVCVVFSCVQTCYGCPSVCVVFSCVQTCYGCPSVCVVFSCVQTCYGCPSVCVVFSCVQTCYGCPSVCVVFSCVQTLVSLPVFGTFKVRTDTDACDFILGLYGQRKSLHWKLTLGEKSLTASGTRTRVSIMAGFLVGFSVHFGPGISVDNGRTRVSIMAGFLVGFSVHIGPGISVDNGRTRVSIMAGFLVGFSVHIGPGISVDNGRTRVSIMAGFLVGFSVHIGPGISVGDDQSILALEYQWTMVSPFWPWNIRGQWSVLFSVGHECSPQQHASFQFTLRPPGYQVYSQAVWISGATIAVCSQAVWVSGSLSGCVGIRFTLRLCGYQGQRWRSTLRPSGHQFTLRLWRFILRPSGFQVYSQAVWVSGLFSGRLDISGNEGPNLPFSDMGHRRPYSHVL